MSEATQKEQLDGAPANEQEAAVASVIAEIASGLKSRLLTKVELFGNHGHSDLATQLARALQDSAIDPTVIQQIGIAEVNIEPSGITALVPTLRGATAITQFELRSTAIGDSGAILVASALRNASGLKFLCLRDESVGNAGAIALAREFGQRQSLEGLSLSGNQIECAGAKALGEAIGELTALYILSLRSNPLGDDGVVAMYTGMRPNTSLEMIIFEDCQICDPETFLTMHEMPLQNVARYYLGKNRVEHQGGAKIAGILHNSTITVLGLDGCELGPVCAVGLAEVLKINTTLAALDLNSNNIMDDGAVALAEGLRHNTGLNSINLSHNCIGDAGAAAIAAALEHNESLGRLVLTNNQVSTVGYKAFKQFLPARRNLFNCQSREILRLATTTSYFAQHVIKVIHSLWMWLTKPLLAVL